MINFWNNALTTITILLVYGMDCQIITWNIWLGELHNSLANPLIVRRYSGGSGFFVDVVFSNKCEHILFKTSWCKSPIYVILVDVQL